MAKQMSATTIETATIEIEAGHPVVISRPGAITGPILQALAV